MSKFDDLVSKNAREKEANDIRAAAAAEKELQEKAALKDWYVPIIRDYFHDFKDTVMRNHGICQDVLVFHFVLGIEIVKTLKIAFICQLGAKRYGLCVDNGKILDIADNASYSKKGYSYAFRDNVKEDELIDAIYKCLNPKTKDEAEKTVYEYFANIINKYTK